MFETSDGRFAFEIAGEHTYCECGVDECDHWEEQYLNVLVAEKVGASYHRIRRISADELAQKLGVG